MLVWLSHRVVKDAWLVAATWVALAAILVAVALSGLGGRPLPDRLHSPGTGVVGTRSAEGSQVLDSLVGDAVIVTLLVSGLDLSSTEQQKEVSAALEDARAELGELVGTDNVLDPFVIPGGLDSDAARSMTATGKDGFIMTVTVNPNGSDVADPEDTRYAEKVSSLVDQATRRLERVPGELTGVAPTATGIVSHDDLVEEELRAQAVDDLGRALLVGAPVVLLLMVLVLGGPRPCVAPILGTAVSVAGALGVLHMMSVVTELPFLAAGAGAATALAASAGYGTVVTSRFREELVRHLDRPDGTEGTEGAGSADGTKAATGAAGGSHRHRAARSDLVTSDPVTAAVAATVLTAGRTVAFCSMAAAVSLCGLYLLGEASLRPVSLACATIIVVSMAVTLTLVPAVLALLGRRTTTFLLPGRAPLLGRVPGPSRLLARGSQDSQESQDPAPLRLLLSRPWAVLAAGLLLLVVLALPLGGLQALSPREERLPAASDQRVFWRALEKSYPAAAEQDATLIIAGTGQKVTDFVNNKVAATPGVTEVVTLATAGDYTVVYLDLEGEEGSATAEDAVRALQKLDPPAELWVTGQAADQVDVQGFFLSHLPVALGVVLAVTGVLLFLLTGSLLAPFPVLALSCLSTTAALGVLTWLLQNRHTASLLGLSAVEGPEAPALALGGALGLGLATGQGILLLGRVTEYHSAGLDNATAVRQGLRRSTRTVLGSAVLAAAAYLGMAVADLPVSRETGLVALLTVLADAVVGRVLLAPAVMRILGRWIWWAPRWLVPPDRNLARRSARRAGSGRSARPDAEPAEQVAPTAG